MIKYLSIFLLLTGCSSQPLCDNTSNERYYMTDRETHKIDFYTVKVCN